MFNLTNILVDVESNALQLSYVLFSSISNGLPAIWCLKDVNRIYYTVSLSLKYKYISTLNGLKKGLDYKKNLDKGYKRIIAKSTIVGLIVRPK